MKIGRCPKPVVSGKGDVLLLGVLVVRPGLAPTVGEGAVVVAVEPAFCATPAPAASSTNVAISKDRISPPRQDTPVWTRLYASGVWCGGTTGALLQHWQR